MSEELKPCPFCGGAPLARKKTIECEQCQAQGPYTNDYERVILGWNTRTQPQHQQDVVSQIELAIWQHHIANWDKFPYDQFLIRDIAKQVLSVIPTITERERKLAEAARMIKDCGIYSHGYNQLQEALAAYGEK